MSEATTAAARPPTPMRMEAALHNGLSDVSKLLADSREEARLRIANRQLPDEVRIQALFRLLNVDYYRHEGKLNERGEVVRPPLRSYLIRMLQDVEYGADLRGLLGAPLADALNKTYSPTGPFNDGSQ